MGLPIIKPEILSGIEGSAMTDGEFPNRTIHEVALVQPVLGQLLAQVHTDMDNGVITREFANGYVNGLMYTYLAFSRQAACDEIEEGL